MNTMFNFGFRSRAFSALGWEISCSVLPACGYFGQRWRMPA
jgi:hypothetical protein